MNHPLVIIQPVLYCIRTTVRGSERQVLPNNIPYKNHRKENMYDSVSLSDYHESKPERDEH